MVWVEIIKTVRDETDNCVYTYFDYFGQEKRLKVTKKVLWYLKLDNFKNIKRLFVVKSFNRFDKEFFLIKKVEHKE